MGARGWPDKGHVHRLSGILISVASDSRSRRRKRSILVASRIRTNSSFYVPSTGRFLQPLYPHGLQWISVEQMFSYLLIYTVITLHQVLRTYCTIINFRRARYYCQLLLVPNFQFNSERNWERVTSSKRKIKNFL